MHLESSDDRFRHLDVEPCWIYQFIHSFSASNIDATYVGASMISLRIYAYVGWYLD